MINFRLLFLFIFLVFNKNLGAFDSRDLPTDDTDVILSWPELDTERLINLDSIASEQSKIKIRLPALKRERDKVKVGLPQSSNSSDIVSLDFEDSKRLRKEFRDSNSGKCIVCEQKLHMQTFSVLLHYHFNKLVLGLKPSSSEHFDILSKICAKSEYADTVAHFAERVKRQMVKKLKK